MSASVITLETPENLSDKLIIQPPSVELSVQGRLHVPKEKFRFFFSFT